MHLSFISEILPPLNLFFRASRAALPSAVPKSATRARVSALAAGSALVLASALPPAKLSFRRPQSPLGSAALIAVPAAVTLPKRTFHSSGVKFDLSVMTSAPVFLLLSDDCSVSSQRNRLSTQMDLLGLSR